MTSDAAPGGLLTVCYSKRFYFFSISPSDITEEKQTNHVSNYCNGILVLFNFLFSDYFGTFNKVGPQICVFFVAVLTDCHKMAALKHCTTGAQGFDLIRNGGINQDQMSDKIADC